MREWVLMIAAHGRSWRLPPLLVDNAVKFMRKHGRVDFKLEARPESAHGLERDGLIAHNANFAHYPLNSSPDCDDAILCRTNAPLLAMRLEVRRRVKISMRRRGH